MNDVALLSALIFLVALLYSSVGHGGASGYLAMMALVGVAPPVMKPAALVLNILVATIGTIRFGKAGCFAWRLFLPFAAGSIPFAFLGGSTALPGTLYRQLLGGLLFFVAVRLWFGKTAAAPPAAERKLSMTSSVLAIACGAVIGYVSGLIGTGGGIFLTPLLLLVGWSSPRDAAGVSAAFILVNSIAALLGHISNVSAFPAALVYWVVAAAIGGLIGSGLGSRRLGSATLQRLLAVVLLIACAKLLLARDPNVRPSKNQSNRLPTARLVPAAE